MLTQGNFWSQETAERLLRFYHSLIKREKMPLEYLQIRRITKKSINKFMLGYSYGSVGYQHIGMTDSLFFRKSGKTYVDRLSNRIVIPIMADGFVRGFTSRAILDTNKPHMHVVAGKMSYLFNHDAIHEENYIVLVESPFDCIQLSQIGINSSATMGTNGVLRYDNIKTLKGLKIFICFDADKNQSGLRGALQLSKILIDVDLKVKVITLPLYDKEKNDISEYLKDHCKLDFENLIEEAISPEYINSSVMRNYRGKINMNSTMGRTDSTLIEKIICPFHNDHNPSLNIYFDGHFHCFGCGKHGEVEELNKKLGVKNENSN